jgi:hypothetical protein
MFFNILKKPQKKVKFFNLLFLKWQFLDRKIYDQFKFLVVIIKECSYSKKNIYEILPSKLCKGNMTARKNKKFAIKNA